MKSICRKSTFANKLEICSSTPCRFVSLSVLQSMDSVCRNLAVVQDSDWRGIILNTKETKFGISVCVRVCGEGKGKENPKNEIISASNHRIIFLYSISTINAVLSSQTSHSSFFRSIYTTVMTLNFLSILFLRLCITYKNIRIKL